VNKDDDVFEYVWCEGLQHRTCLQISTDQYSALSDVSSNILFFCSSCLSKLPEALRAFDSVNDACSQVEKSIKTIEVNLLNRFDGLTDQMNDLATKIVEANQELSDEEVVNSGQIANIVGPKHHSNLSTTFSSILSEEREKDKRKLNLILHNVPESTDINSDVRKQCDTDTAKAVFNQHLGIATSVSNATRLGKKGNRSRLLRVTVSSERDKAIILRNSTKVRSTNGEEFLKKLYITPDLTPTEREQNKALRSKLKEMNQQGNKYRIKNGQIVLRENKVPSAQQSK